MSTDVLVVGAGPTGLMLACQLARRGVRVQIIDRRAGPAEQTRALGVHARTLEIYAHLGIADAALDRGRRATGANLWARGRRAARVPLGDIGRHLSPYPFVLILGQDDNERLLGDVLRRHGVSVRWNSELVALEQHSGGVRAALAHADGTRGQVAAAWLAGCDGAHSTVRERLGIAFEGAPYEHVFFVVDTQVTGSMVSGEVNVYLWHDGFHLFFPMRGTDHWRIVGILPPELRDRDDVVFEDVIPSLRHEAGTSQSFGSASWFSTYRIHHRRAARFRDGRCFLLGDAAHVHSPVGAQGMNTGLQDAYNLAWKLALVAAGRAGPALLDCYQAERMPVAQRLLATTDRAFSLVVSNRLAARLFRTRILARIAAVAMRVERIRELAFRTVSQIGIRYRHSPLSQSVAPAPTTGPRAGDRFPWLELAFRPQGTREDLFARLDDTRFNLILVGQTLPAEGLPPMEELLRVHEVAGDADRDRALARTGIPHTAFYLLRPDGHVGLAGTRLDAAAVSRYLSRWLTPASSGI